MHYLPTGTDTIVLVSCVTCRGPIPSQTSAMAGYGGRPGGRRLSQCMDGIAAISA